MEHIFSAENVNGSVEEVLQKNDSCGIDGIFVSQYAEYWKLNQEKILSSLVVGSYRPDAVQLVEVLKKNGKKRVISKYTCTDRVVLDVLKRELTPLWDGCFSTYSYAYQENKGVQEAVRQAAKYIEENKEWVVELDIQDFFDNINLERLESMIRKKVQNPDLMKLIHKYLYPWMVDNGEKKRKVRGLVQGNPVSPLLSNVYMEEFDHYLESRYHFCRFSDDLRIYCNSFEEAQKVAEDVETFLKTKLGLGCNHAKTGIYPSITRKYLGYEFYRTGEKKEVLVKRVSRDTEKYYRKWHSSAIQKIDREYHLINDGILTKRDYTLLFENDEKKCYIPVETCGAINIYSNVVFSNSFFDYANKKRLKVNLFDKYGEYIGGFCTSSHYDAGKTMLKQASIYNDAERRLAMAKSIEIASLHNQRENLRYYFKHKRTPELKTAIDDITSYMAEMKACGEMEKMMLIEARAKQRYLQSFDFMIQESSFRFEKRTRRPPQNEVNAMISFGNVFLYQRISTEIHKTALDIRIGFAHATNNRSESLNLDVAEIFKPIIVDRAIFTVIHNMEILANEHFDREGEKGVYLNKEGKRVFIKELEQKLYQKITVDGQRMTYDTLIRNEIRKIVHYVQRDVKYKPFKYT